MADKKDKKILYVDFQRGTKPTRGGFGGTPKQLFAVFLGVLCVELAGVAVLYPSAVTSSFFAPTVIAVAVAGTVGARRLAARYQISRLHRQTVERRAPFHDEDDDHKGRTLH